MELLIFAIIVYLIIGDIAKGIQMQRARKKKEGKK